MRAPGRPQARIPSVSREGSHMKQSLLVELNTEELPPKALKSLSEAFASGLAKGLRDRQFLSDDSVVTAFGAPRRLAVHITHVLYRSPDKPFKQKLMPLAVARDAASNWTHAFLKKLESLGRRPHGQRPGGNARRARLPGRRKRRQGRLRCSCRRSQPGRACWSPCSRRSRKRSRRCRSRRS